MGLPDPLLVIEDESMVVSYSRGIHQLAADTFAYLRPSGSWGFSNCGLVVSGDRALLVDTQFDLPMTRELLTAVKDSCPGVVIETVVTTHPNGDHCWGNQLVAGATKIGSAACRDALSHEVPPAQLAALSAPDGPATALGDYMRRYFGHFDFRDIAVTGPDRTFTGRLDVRVGDRVVELIEVGPAHTDGDVIVHVPDARTVFTGDILFVDDHPIMWTGPAESWIKACDVILQTGAEFVVPGHGPVTDLDGVRLFRTYLELVAEQGSHLFAAGVPYWQAADEIRLPQNCARWGHRERLVITLSALYANLGQPRDELLAVLAHAAEFEQRIVRVGS
ncbi:MBL fold metallo-hydrolase [Actinoplanes sp. NPDC051859]|uniref:MBL fold metallo-hydrolase n=1 Tax=Actinoplanes sp. NPDC051859 TaxID=3363909 RepID=UPI0037B563AD